MCVCVCLKYVSMYASVCLVSVSVFVKCVFNNLFSLPVLTTQTIDN